MLGGLAAVVPDQIQDVAPLGQGTAGLVSSENPTLIVQQRYVIVLAPSKTETGCRWLFEQAVQGGEILHGAAQLPG